VRDAASEEVAVTVDAAAAALFARGQLDGANARVTAAADERMRSADSGAEDAFKADLRAIKSGGVSPAAAGGAARAAAPPGAAPAALPAGALTLKKTVLGSFGVDCFAVSNFDDLHRYLNEVTSASGVASREVPPQSTPLAQYFSARAAALRTRTSLPRHEFGIV
jgi:hypothetical protein